MEHLEFATGGAAPEVVAGLTNEAWQEVLTDEALLREFGIDPAVLPRENPFSVSAGSSSSFGITEVVTYVDPGAARHCCWGNGTPTPS